MRFRKAIVAGLFVLVSAAGIAVPTVASAAVTAPAAVSTVHPAFSANCPCNIIMSNNDALGAPNPAAGNPITEEQFGRNLTWSSQTTYLGYDAGYWTLNTNGNYVAATNNCDGLTVKSSNTSNGVVWAMRYDSGSGKWYIINRYCDQVGNWGGTAVMGGNGTRGVQMFVGLIGGAGYLRMCPCTAL